MDSEDVGLKRYSSAIRRRGWIVVASMLGFALISTLYVVGRPAEYAATAEVLIKPYSSAQFNEPDFSAAQVATQVQVMQSGAVVGPVVHQLNLQESASTLQKSVSASSVSDTSILSVTVTNKNPQAAADIANQLAKSYITFRQNTLPAGAHNTSYAKVVNFAQIPRHPSGTRPLIAALFGLVIGMVLGCIAALAVDRRDKAIKDESALAEITGGLPVLGRIPGGRRRTRGPSLVERRGSPEGVAYRFLATTVRLLKTTDRPQGGPQTGPHRPTIALVVSAAPRDGRTSVAVNMAFAAAEAGGRVLVCDADLTQPGLTKLLHIQDQLMLESLLGRALPIGLDLMAHPAPNVYAIGTSAVLVSQSALLGDGNFAALVSRLPATVDLVIVDTSPLLSSADVLDLIPQSDVLLLVVRERATLGSDVEMALDRIRRVGGEVAGVVVTGSHAPLGTQRSMRRRTSSAIVANFLPSAEPSETEDSASATQAFKR